MALIAASAPIVLFSARIGFSALLELMLIEVLLVPSSTAVTGR